MINLFVWSGPRNISTALMRSFENRKDTKVYDEPFYATTMPIRGLASYLQMKHPSWHPPRWQSLQFEPREKVSF